MKKSIQYVREALSSFYEPLEIESFISLIFNYIFGYSKKELILNADITLPESEFHKVEKIVLRLKKCEPIQYILGETEFYFSKFKVNSGVLIPRFETEELVDLIVKRKKRYDIKILDIGIGSGCIAISLKKHIPYSEVWGCDISDEALEISSVNAKLNEVEIALVKYDVLGKNKFPEVDFDLIVSNPPYVTEIEKIAMQNNVLNFEPKLALFVPDDDPILFYREIVLKSKRLLKPKGELYFEINEAYGNEILVLLGANGFEAEIIKDINGKERFAFAKQIG